MADIALFLALFAAAYLIGSLPVGYSVGRARGIDVRREGSGSTGATNIMRTLGKRWALAILLIDLLKGAGLAYFAGDILLLDDFISLTVVFAAVLGHVFPVFLKFKGGKGVAVISGGLAVIAWDPIIVPAVVCFWLVILFFKRKMSLANLLTFCMAVPVCLYAIYGSWIWFVAGLGLLSFLLFTHRENIARLIKGEEKEINFKF